MIALKSEKGHYTDALLDIMLAVQPNATKIGLLHDLCQDSSTTPINAAKAILDSKGIAYVERTGTTTSEVMLAAQALVADGVDAVFTPSDNTIMTAELAIYKPLMVTHNMRQALELGNRTLMMDDGRIELDVKGTERSRMTVDDLLSRFKGGVGKNLDNDRILLSE